MSNPQHLAEPNFKTMFTEPLYAMQYGQNTPDRNGRHRKWNAVKVRIVNTPDVCIPCEQITLDRKKADA